MHITAIIVMTESILTHQQETFEYHVNHERIPVQIYLDSSEACQVIGDEIIQQINKRSPGQAFVLGLALKMYATMGTLMGTQSPIGKDTRLAAIAFRVARPCSNL